MNQNKLFRVCSIILLCFSLLLASCGSEDDSGRIESDANSNFYDTVEKVSVMDLGDIIVLNYCEETTADFTLPTEFYGGKKINAVGDGAFAGNDTIVNVTIPDGYTYIGYFAFMECENLETVYIGKDVCDLGENTFSKSNNIKEFKVSSENPNFYNADGCILQRSTDILYVSNGTIPSSAKGIYNSVFIDNINITDITIPEGVKSIGVTAFSGSTLSSVTLPDSLETISDYAFSDTDLKEIYIPAGVTTVGEEIFSGMSDIIINCEADSKPEGWSDYWLSCCENYQLNWGVAAE